MDPGERATGTRDEHYNLIAVLYHALQGAENCEVYAVDAEVAGRNDQAAFFREAQDMQRDLADRAKGLLGIGGLALGKRGVTTLGTAETGTEIPPRTELPPDDTGRPVDVRGRVAPEVGIPPEGIAGPEASPRTEPSGIRTDTEEARLRPEEPIARAEEAAPPRPVPSGDLPGTEPIREEAPPTRARGVPPAPEEIPPERAGEIPTAEEVPPPRAEEIPSGTSPQGTQGDDLKSGAPPGDLPRSTEDVPPQLGDDVPDEPPDAPPGAPSSRVPLVDEDPLAETGGVVPDAPAEGEDVVTAAEAARGERAYDSPREAPPPGEERPERRGVVPSTDTPREAPPPGEERPEKRTP